MLNLKFNVVIVWVFVFVCSEALRKLTVRLINS